jgi:hypothetical protein
VLSEKDSMAERRFEKKKEPSSRGEVVAELTVTRLYAQTPVIAHVVLSFVRLLTESAALHRLGQTQT